MIEGAVNLHNGRVVDTQGDAFFCVFQDAADALAAAVQAQRGLASDTDLPRVRLGLHTGVATVADNGYLGVSVHRAQRICSAAHGKQILLSNATREVVADDLSRGVDLRDLGEHELKDLDRPARLFQAIVDGLASNFPPPRTGAPDPAAGPSVQGRALSRRFLLILGAVALVAGIAIAYAVFRQGSGGPTLSRVEPNSVGVIDPDRNALVSEVPVGNQPTQIAVGGDSVWVANAGDRTAMQIDPETGTIERTRDTRFGRAGSDRRGRSHVGRRKPSSSIRRYPRRRDLGHPHRSEAFRYSVSFPQGRQCLRKRSRERGPLAGPGGSFVEADPRTLRVRSRRGDVRFAVDMVSGGGSLWILNAGAPGSQGTVTEYNPGSRIVGETTSVGLDPVAIAYGAGAVWVGLASGAVVRIDPKQQTPSSTVPSAAGLVDLAVGEESVWVGRRVSPTDDRIDPETLEVTDTIDIGKVWVTAY